MDELVFAGAYLAGAMLTMRLTIRWQAKEFPSLGWSNLDTGVTLLLGAVWPIALPVAWLSFGPKLALPTILPFERWLEADKRRNRDEG